MRHYEHYTDGREINLSTREYFPTVKSFTGETCAMVARGNETDVDLAVAAAERAGEGEWAALKASGRGRLLRKLADLHKGGDARVFLEFNRCKKSVARDLSEPGARERLHDLLADDIFLLGAPASVVNTIPEALKDQQLAARPGISDPSPSLGADNALKVR